MNFLKSTLLIFIPILLMFSCKDDEPMDLDNIVNLDDIVDIQSIPVTQYYESDILQEDFYGTWIVYSRSKTGINGKFELSIDFDFLEFKPNAIFGIIRNEELITFGKLEFSDNQDLNVVNFIGESDKEEANVQFLLHNNIKMELDKIVVEDFLLFGQATLLISYGNEEIILTKEN